MDFVTPAGFRDIMPDEALRREQTLQRVQALFAERGYLPIETPTLERLDVMQAGGRMPGSPFKLFDAAGDLLALRPDVTMQVARMCATRLRGQEGPFKFRYTQRVFRETDSQASARELTQVGLENIGQQGSEADAEVVGLLARSLRLCGMADFRIALGTVGVLRALLQACQAPGEWKNDVLAAYHQSNFPELDRLTSDKSVPAVFARAIAQLPRIRGGREAIDQARAMVEPLGCADGLSDLDATFAALADAGLEDALLVDFSIMSSFDYYTGIVFEAYAPGSGTSLGSGGRYDQMLSAYDGIDRPASGFAFYLEAVLANSLEADAAASPGTRPGAVAAGSPREYLEAVLANSLEADAAASPGTRPGAVAAGSPREGGFALASDAIPGTRETLADPSGPASSTASGEGRMPPRAVPHDENSPVDCFSKQDCLSMGAYAPLPQQGSGKTSATDRPLRIAVPKGSLAADTIACLQAAGLDTTGLDEPGRQLVISNPGVDFIIVRPTDAPAFVALGAADCGICGKDSLLEAGPEVVELVDLGFGGCRFVVAEPAGATDAVMARYAQQGSIRVATKYPNITRAYYERIGMQADIVKLHGNIELAPMVGMADRIVDITATGTTLRENNLEIVDEVLSSTARFFANTCAFRTDERVVELARALAEGARVKEGE